MQKFWKSVKIWQSYREFTGGPFFLRHSVDAFWVLSSKLSECNVGLSQLGWQTVPCTQCHCRRAWNTIYVIMRKSARPVGPWGAICPRTAKFNRLLSVFLDIWYWLLKNVNHSTVRQNTSTQIPEIYTDRLVLRPGSTNVNPEFSSSWNFTEFTHKM